MKIKVIVKITAEDIYKLDTIGRSEKASSGYGQDFDFCLTKAIEEFIEKYSEATTEE